MASGQRKFKVGDRVIYQKVHTGTIHEIGETSVYYTVKIKWDNPKSTYTSENFFAEIFFEHVATKKVDYLDVTRSVAGR